MEEIGFLLFAVLEKAVFSLSRLPPPLTLRFGSEDGFSDKLPAPHR